MLLKGFNVFLLLFDLLIIILFFASLFTFVGSILSLKEAQQTNSLSPVIDLTTDNVKASFNLPIKNNGFFDLKTRFEAKVLSADKRVLGEGFTEKTIKPNEIETLSVVISMPINDAMKADSLSAFFGFKTLNDLISMNVFIEIPKSALGENK